VWLIDEIAERHICQAIDRGELDNLPGTGKPITLDDDRMVPEELRAGYRLLKNAGYAPPEVEALREIRNLQALLARIVDAQTPDTGIRRLRLLEARLAECYGRGFSASAWQQYRDQLAASIEKAEPEQGA